MKNYKDIKRVSMALMNFEDREIPVNSYLPEGYDVKKDEIKLPNDKHIITYGNKIFVDVDVLKDSYIDDLRDAYEKCLDKHNATRYVL